MSESSHSFEFGIMCCMLSTFHVSSRIVANNSKSSILPSQYLFRLCWKKTLLENYLPYLKTCSSKFCYHRLFSLYFLYRYIFSLLSSVWFVIAVCGSISVGELAKYLGKFPHLAIAVSPQLEVESSGHASMDGCNFQRKQLLPPRSTASATLCREFRSGRWEHKWRRKFT